jgi:hypothetical protein
MDDVVQCLQDPTRLHRAGPDRFIATFACFLGLLEAPPNAMLSFAWGGVDPVLAGVTAELKIRYEVDLDELATQYYGGD